MLTWCTYICIEFTIYETLMEYLKNKHGEKEFKKREMLYNLLSGVVGGCLAAAITNPLECITVNQQTT